MRALRVVALSMLGVLLFAGPASAANLSVGTKMTPDNKYLKSKGPKGVAGDVLFDVNTDTNQLCYTITLTGVKDKVTAIHVHDTYQGDQEKTPALTLDVSKLEIGKPFKGCVNDVNSILIIGNAPRHLVDVHTDDRASGIMGGYLEYVGDATVANPEIGQKIEAQTKITPAPARPDYTPIHGPEGLLPKTANEMARTGSGLAMPLTFLGLALVGTGAAARVAGRRR